MRQVFTIFLLFLSTGLYGQSVDSLGWKKFQEKVLALQGSESIRYGTVAISVRDTKDGRVIFGTHPHQSLPSASILKLVTTATAMELLGESYQFQTPIEYDGMIQGDTLVGNIYIRGVGDPSLGSARFQYQINELRAGIRSGIRKMGVKHIQGAVLVDDSFFNGNAIADTWLYEDLAHGYGAGVHALNFNENQFNIKLKAGVNPLDPVQVVTVQPNLAGMQILNQIKTGGKDIDSRIRIYNRSPSAVELQGELRVGNKAYGIQVAMPNPGLYAIDFFRESIDSVTISQQGALATSHLARRPLYVHHSPVLKKMIQETNWWSLNLYADIFLRMIGKKMANDASFETSVKVMRRHWENKGIDLRGFYIKDGSGLSVTGSLTTQNMTDILNTISLQPYFKDYLETLPVLGKEGTLRGLGLSKNLNQIRAKSGSLEGTRAYAGYVHAKSGQLLSFAFIAHRYDPDQKDQIKKKLVELMTLLTDL
jgi:D-alanyl-D-alanine carboxypeptidase/D-alanyl-D-alanine-endopeptidase (penicillin-binding protein 4)